ncbi:MAG: hypothetical protein IPO07_20605 [Haliscomenobacter sp.]|nr:hypothetical protein [Haliscomenobacter sp.]MBK9490916.1 hypothetical protein [Haliscomenobacter sp.]
MLQHAVQIRFGFVLEFIAEIVKSTPLPGLALSVLLSGLLLVSPTTCQLALGVRKPSRLLRGKVLSS